MTHDIWIETGCENPAHEQYFCGACENCGPCTETEVAELDGLELDDSAKYALKDHTSTEMICTECVTRILKKIEQEAAQAFMDAEELNGETFTMKEGG